MIPPTRTKGVAKIQTRAILHSKSAEKVIPAAKLRTASMRTDTVSVVRPFKFWMSSDRIFERIPGALSFLSNHETYLYMSDLKSIFLTS